MNDQKNFMYIEKIRPYIGVDLIKVISGMRRCGKSVIVEQLRDEITTAIDPGVPLCVALVAACVGNARFHLSAGKAVLDVHEGKGGPIGLFISTGALGLFAGMKLTGGYGLWCILGFGAALAAVGVAAVWRLRRSCGRCGNRDGVRKGSHSVRAAIPIKRKSRLKTIAARSGVRALPSHGVSSSSPPSSRWSRGGAGRDFSRAGISATASDAGS